MSIVSKIIVFIVFSILWTAGYIIYFKKKKSIDSNKTDSSITPDIEHDSNNKEEENDGFNPLIEGLSFKLEYPKENLKEGDYDKLSEMVISMNSIMQGKYDVPEKFVKENKGSEKAGKEETARKEKHERETTVKSNIVHKKSGYIEDVDNFFQKG